jgi:glycosyltransferase involved in cell wall biosynthesis
VNVEGANLREPLVLKRVHAAQASLRQGELQSSFQRQVALREIARVAPKLSSREVELAWQFGTGRASSAEAASAYLELLNVFERLHGIDREARDAAVRALLGAGHVSRALRLGVAHPGRLAVRGARRRLRARRIRPSAASWLAELDSSRDLRVVVVSPEPTPYRSPLFDRIAGTNGIDLTVIYAAATVADRTWSVHTQHQTEFLSGRRVPGMQRLLRHEYPVTPGIGQALTRADPDVVVVSGWSTFASQAAVLWSRRHRVPYILLVESHDAGPRAGWRRGVKGAVVPRLVDGAANVLVVGTAARQSMIDRGARPEDVRIFANTVDLEAWSDRAAELARDREALRGEAGLRPDDVVVLSVGRLVPDKGMDTLVRAVAASGDKRLRAVLVGGGSGRIALEALARELSVVLRTTGDLPQHELAKEYVRADVFALLSLHETWGVVVNEAAVSGLPLVLSERVGAARDLIREGENGFVVPASDVQAAAQALAQLAGDPDRRRSFGTSSRELVSSWSYEASVESFLGAVRAAIAR